MPHLVPRGAQVEVWSRCGGVAERRGNGLQSRLHGFESRLHLGAPHDCRMHARLAQRESASLTRKRSLVQSQYRPHKFPQVRVGTET